MTAIAQIFVVFLFIAALPYAAAWFRIYGNRIRQHESRIIEEGDVPENIMACLEAARKPLTDMGFVYSHCAFFSKIYEYDDYDKHCQVYIHPEARAYASVHVSLMPSGRQPFSVTFVSVSEDKSISMTVDCIAHLMPPGPSHLRIWDHFFGDFTQQWNAHQAQTADKALVAPTSELVQETDSNIIRDLTAHLESKKIVVPDPEGQGLRFTASGAWTMARRIVAGSKKQSQLEASKAESPSQPTRDEAILTAELEAFDRHSEINEKRQAGDRLRMAKFLLSAFLFVTAMGVLWSWEFAAIILLIVLIHELGHLGAMALFGYKNRQILFLPFMGAAAMGEKQGASALQKIVVLMSGPVPGMLLGLVCIDMYINTETDFFLLAGVTALFINYLNLLPITPLDGGKIVDVLLFSRLPRVQFLFFLASLFAMTAGAVLLREWFFLFIAGFLALSAPHKWRMGVAAAKAKTLLNGRKSKEDLKKAAVLAMAETAIMNKPFQTRHGAVSMIVDNLESRAPGFVEIALGAFFYVFALLLPVWYIVYREIFHIWTTLQ